MFWARLCASWACWFGYWVVLPELRNHLVQKEIFFFYKSASPHLLWELFWLENIGQRGVKREKDMRAHTFAMWADSMLLEL